MKNYLSLLSAAVLLLSSCSNGAPRQQTDLESNDVRGMVQSIDLRTQRTIYNRQGYITETLNIGKGVDSTDLQLSKINYDESGTVPLEILHYKYINDLSSPDIERTEVTPEQHAQRTKAQRGAKYNKAGYPTLRSFYVDPEDSSAAYYKKRPRYISEYFYNDQNQVVELRSTRYGPKVVDNQLDGDTYISLGTQISHYTYNEQGDVSEVVTTIDIGKELGHTYTYKYDEHNNWIEKTIDGKETTTRTIRYYDEQ